MSILFQCIFTGICGTRDSKYCTGGAFLQHAVGMCSLEATTRLLLTTDMKVAKELSGWLLAETSGDKLALLEGRARRYQGMQ